MNKIYYERPKNLQNQNKSNGPKKQGYTHANDTLQYQQVRMDDAHMNMQENSPYMSSQEQESQYYQPSYEAPVYEARNPEVSKNSLIKEWIANGALIVLSLALVLSIIMLITEMSYSFRSYNRDADDLWWYVNNGNYVELVTARNSNEAAGVFETNELSEIYAVADYFEAASLYKVAVFKNDTADMDKYLTEMGKAYIEMNDINYLAEDINEKLGIVIPE